MRPIRVLAALATATLALTVAACGVTSQTSHCSGGVCQFAFQGAQTLDLDFLRPAATLELKDFGKDQMKVASQGSETTVRVGQLVTVAGFTVSLKALDGDSGTLLVRNAS